MQKDRLSGVLAEPIMPAMKTAKRLANSGVNAYRNVMDKGGNMTTRELKHRTARLTAGVLARPRELFGDSLPELLLVGAVMAAVVSAVVALNAG
jgi:hypothetical protein